MSDFRLINALFDCESCIRKHYDRSGIRACDLGQNGDDCRYYRRDPAYKRKGDKPIQSSEPD